MPKPNRQTQLEWSHADDMHWEDLPADLRDRVRELLGQLLRHVAGQGHWPQGAADET